MVLQPSAEITREDWSSSPTRMAFGFSGSNLQKTPRLCKRTQITFCTVIEREGIVSAVFWSAI